MSKFFDGELLSGYEESPKTTIFGEEHFIDTTMIKLVQQKNEAVDNYIFEQMANSVKGSVLVEMPQVIIDKEKLKKWVVLCMKLENIEHSELVDMATKKRIYDLEARLADSKRKYEDRKQFCITEARSLTDIINNLLEENNELKQQLADKEKQCRECKHLNKKIELNIKNKLMAELAEKEKELAYMTKQAKKFNNEAQKYFEDACCNDSDNQDKISFAVEQLKKVKEWCKGNASQCFYNEAGTEIKEKHIVVDRPQENGSPSLIKYIDNQIKQLKEGK